MWSWWLNIIGLAFGAVGAFMMYFWPPVYAPNITDDSYISSLTPLGSQALKKRRRVAGLGVLLLLLGFALQFVAAIVGR